MILCRDCNRYNFNTINRYFCLAYIQSTCQERRQRECVRTRCAKQTDVELIDSFCSVNCCLSAAMLICVCVLYIVRMITNNGYCRRLSVLRTASDFPLYHHRPLIASCSLITYLCLAAFLVAGSGCSTA